MQLIKSDGSSFQRNQLGSDLGKYAERSNLSWAQSRYWIPTTRFAISSQTSYLLSLPPSIQNGHGYSELNCSSHIISIALNCQ